MRTFLGAVPLSLAALGLAVVAAYVFSGPVARTLGTRRGLAWFLLFGFGLVASATLVPTAAALEGAVSDGVCDVSRVGLASIRELTSVTFASLNVLLFVPLGLAVGLLPFSRAGVVATLAAVSLTFVVEAVQLLVPQLGRGCETADMVDNLLGLVVGLVLGRLAVPLVRPS